MKRQRIEKYVTLWLVISLIAGLAIGMIAFSILTNLGDYSNVVAAIVGAIVALFIPIWQTFIIQKSKLTLEVNGISRKVSDKALISLDEYSELVYLRKMREEDRAPFMIINGALKKSHSGVRSNFANHSA